MSYRDTEITIPYAIYESLTKKSDQRYFLIGLLEGLADSPDLPFESVREIARIGLEKCDLDEPEYGFKE